VRREFQGPGPLALGLLIVVVALLSPARAPPPPCACEVLTPVAFAQLDAGGYPGVAAGDPLVVDGHVVALYPSEFVDWPYRYVRFEGSDIQFNVTGYTPATGRVGEWVRISTTHGGEREANGPDQGHRWTQVGKTAPQGTSVLSLASLAFGLSAVAWGVVSWREFGRTGVRAADLRGRLAAARESRAKDPGAKAAEGMGRELEASGKMLRRGQYDSAQKTLEGVEAQVARAQRLGSALEELRAAALAEEKKGFAAGKLLTITDEAGRERVAGNVPAAEALVTKAGEFLRALPRVREMIQAAEASAAASAALGVEDAQAGALLDEARALLARGEVEEALPVAARAVERAREVSPSAQAAARELARLKDFLQLRPEFDRSREVRDRVRDGDELYRLGQFERARAEALVGIWIADATSLEHAGFVAIARAALAHDGYAVKPPGADDPTLGFIATRGGKRVLVVSAAWRDYPSERILLAAKDFINEGGAERALVYSCAFSNTSTDDRIEVVDASRLVEMLRAAALEQVAADRLDGATAP
jgi:tetratricopeptide (TPR) repeat protein